MHLMKGNLTPGLDDMCAEIIHLLLIAINIAIIVNLFNDINYMA